MLFTNLLLWLESYKYLFIFLSSIVQGPVVMTASGALLRLGQVHFWPVYLTLMAADLTGDTLWYFIGYRYARPFTRKYGRFFGMSEQLLDKSERAFKKYQYKILFFSKITMGLGFALLILMTAGMVRVPFKKYIAFNAIGQFFWTGLLLAVGYFFGTLYLRVNHGMEQLGFFALIIMTAVALVGFGKYLHQKGEQVDI